MKENEIIADVKDILIELSDMGHSVNIELEESKSHITEYLILKVNIKFKKPIEANDELYNDLISLKLYLNNNGYEDFVFNYRDTQQVHKFYLHDDSRKMRNDDIHKYERWLRISSMNLVFMKSIGKVTESKIKKFKSFLETKNEKYSIYDFFNSLNRFSRREIDIKNLKPNCDHFIGPGSYDKIENYVDKLISSINKVNLDDIELRLLDDIYDNINSDIKKSISFGILNGDYYNYDIKDENKYNSTSFYKDIIKSKMIIISEIIREIIHPTLYIQTKLLRNTNESEYVTGPEWNCQNFNIDKYINDLDIKSYKYSLLQKSKYSIDNVINMHKPAIICNLEGQYGRKHTIMNIDKIESYIDEALECILPTINYESVIFDHSRYTRQFEFRDFYDYTFKIILK